MRWTLICSLFLVASSLLAQGASEWLERLSQAEKRGKEAVNSVLEEMQTRTDFPDAKWKPLLSEALSSGKESDVQEIKKRLEFYSQWEKPLSTPARELAQDILKEPVFREAREEGVRQNWLARALERLSELANPPLKPRTREVPEFEVRKPRDAPFLFYVAWTILGVALLTASVALWHHLRSQKITLIKKKTKIKGERSLLSPEEERVTLDEWLDRTKRLEAQGRLREAYRCLYISLLTTLAQERLIRWEPWKTNWEHLWKIEASPAPKEVSYRALTQLFDRVWYGQRSPSPEEWAFAKEQFQLLYEKLGRVS